MKTILKEGESRLNSREKVMRLAEVCEDRKAKNVVILDLDGLTLIADYFLVCHGSSGVHIDAITEGIEESLKDLDEGEHRVEGTRGEGWILVDCGDVIAHIFSADDREYYALERLWGDAEVVSDNMLASK